MPFDEPIGFSDRRKGKRSREDKEEKRRLEAERRARELGGWDQFQQTPWGRMLGGSDFYQRHGIPEAGGIVPQPVTAAAPGRAGGVLASNIAPDGGPLTRQGYVAMGEPLGLRPPEPQPMISPGYIGVGPRGGGDVQNVQYIPDINNPATWDTNPQVPVGGMVPTGAGTRIPIEQFTAEERAAVAPQNRATERQNQTALEDWVNNKLLPRIEQARLKGYNPQTGEWERFAPERQPLPKEDPKYALASRVLTAYFRALQEGAELSPEEIDYAHGLMQQTGLTSADFQMEGTTQAGGETGAQPSAPIVRFNGKDLSLSDAKKLRDSLSMDLFGGKTFDQLTDKEKAEFDKHYGKPTIVRK